MSSVVPEGWNSTDFGEIASKIEGGGTPSRTVHEYWNGNIPWATVKDLTDTFLSGTQETITELGLKESSSKLIPKNTVILATRMAVGKAVIFNVDVAINQDLKAVYPKGNVDWRFLLQWYLSKSSHIEAMGTGSTVKGIRLDDLKAIPVDLPPRPEQQIIASILTSVDEVIEKTESQINKLQDLKKGMMQELLTKGIGHTDFKDSPVGRIPKGWEITTYNSVLKKIDSGWSPNCIETPPNIGKWGVLKVSAVTRDRFIELESKTLPKALEPRESIRVTKGDILLTRANGVAELVGKCVKVTKEPKRKLMMSDKILRLLPNKCVNSEFLLHTFNSKLTRTQIEQSWGGSSGQKNISQANIKSFLLPLPPLKEQKDIGDTLSSIDSAIDFKLLHLKRNVDLKKALMQDLLTGKVRVNVN